MHLSGKSPIIVISDVLTSLSSMSIAPCDSAIFSVSGFVSIPPTIWSVCFLMCLQSEPPISPRPTTVIFIKIPPFSHGAFPALFSLYHFKINSKLLRVVIILTKKEIKKRIVRESKANSAGNNSICFCKSSSQ